MRRAFLASIVLITAGLVSSACTVKKADRPSLSGPSELGLSLSLYANPDTLTQDGSSQAQVVIQARDPNGQPVKNLPLRVDISVGGIIVDYGALTAKNLVTGSDGRASTAYTAPPQPLVAQDDYIVVSIIVTPVGSDYANATRRTVDIRLHPPGIIVPPNGTPEPDFTFSPSDPRAYADVVFDARSSRDDGQIVSFSWAFGDGGTGSGAQATHRYAVAGEYVVTLTVTDDRGQSASVSKNVRVMTSTAPTASFVFSPDEPAVNEMVYFNAAQSKAAPGRTIVGYDWDFGTGSHASGMTATKAYSTQGTYTVTLTVTDDVGQTGTAARTVDVGLSGPSSPVAAFTFSPTSPMVGTRVQFNAGDSTSSAGIAGYEWDFGEGSHTKSGPTTYYTYNTAGAYVVRLTITDNNGKTDTTTRTVTVGEDTPVAAFSYSPPNPKLNSMGVATVYFNAADSKSTVGIASYEWDFGDGDTATGATAQHGYHVADTYIVRLTITDKNGNTATATQTVTVAPPAPVPQQ